MDRNNLTTRQARQLKFAEAGVLFVLVMALTVFLGVKLTADQPEVAANDEPAAAVAPASVVRHSAQTDGNPTVAAAAATVDEPLPAVAAVPDPASTELTEPIVVTYDDAEAAFRAERWTEAAELFVAYTTAHPNNAWGYYMLGLSQLRDGEPAAAEQSLLTALDIAPNHVKSLVNLARVRLELGEAVAALEPLQQAVAVAPDDVQARRVLGRALHELGRSDDAIAAYHDALRIEPDDAWSLNNLGLLYIEAERFAAALAPLARACQIDSSVASFANNLGVALERSGQPGAAAAAFAAALSADADYAKAAAALERLEECGAAAEPITIDLAALAAELRFGPDAETLAAAEPTAAAEPRTTAVERRSDDERP